MKRTKLQKLISWAGARGFFRWMPDELYLRWMFWARMGTRLNLENPQTFNEKLQWLKLYDRKPEYTVMVDKYLVRDYIAQTIGEEYLIPLLGVWDDPEEIDFEALPQQFVLKCNHNSGLGMCICKDKETLDIPKVKRELKRGLQQNYYLTGREWPYKDVPRKIICEKYMSDGNTAGLTDYKFMCFHGQVKCIFTCTDRHMENGLKVTFFDTNWNKLSFIRHYPSSSQDIPAPQNFILMKKLAEKLAQGIPFVRVDFYEIDGRVYFGELTFFPGSGMEDFSPIAWDYKIGEWVKMDKLAKESKLK